MGELLNNIERMKDDLKRLLDEFLKDTWEDRQEEMDIQKTESMPKKTIKYTREPTVTDLIIWLNDN